MIEVGFDCPARFRNLSLYRRVSRRLVRQSESDHFLMPLDLCRRHVEPFCAGLALSENSRQSCGENTLGICQKTRTLDEPFERRKE